MTTKLIKSEIEFRCGICSLGALTIEDVLKHCRAEGHPKFTILSASIFEIVGGVTVDRFWDNLKEVNKS